MLIGRKFTLRWRRLQQGALHGEHTRANDNRCRVGFPIRHSRIFFAAGTLSGSRRCLYLSGNLRERSRRGVGHSPVGAAQSRKRGIVHNAVARRNRRVSPERPWNCAERRLARDEVSVVQAPWGNDDRRAQVGRVRSAVARSPRSRLRPRGLSALHADLLHRGLLGGHKSRWGREPHIRDPRSEDRRACY